MFQVALHKRKLSQEKYTHPSCFAEFRFQDPLWKPKIHKLTAPQKCSSIFSVFLFFADTVRWGVASFFHLHLLEHCMVWLKHPFELSNNSDAPTHWRVWVWLYLLSGWHHKFVKMWSTNPHKVRDDHILCWNSYILIAEHLSTDVSVW